MSSLPVATLPAHGLASFWDETRLRADEARSATVRPAAETVSWRIALEDVLKIGYGIQTQSWVVAGARRRIVWRTVPSAGGLYPFEVIANVFGDAAYLWDVDAARLVPLDREPLSRADVAAAGIVDDPGAPLAALLILVARPWLSMVKYRRRGYTYTHLDVGHVTTNLALYTTALGYAPAVHLRFRRVALAERLQLAGLCREPLAVLSFAGDEAGVVAPVGPEAAAGAERRGLAPPDLPEILAWESLEGIRSFEGAPAPPAAAESTPLLAEPVGIDNPVSLPLPAGSPLSWAAAQLRAAILRRRSAKGFRGESLSLTQIGRLLAAVRTAGLVTDCPADEAVRLGVRLVATDVEGLAGVFAYSPENHALHQLGGLTHDPHTACMRQEIARKMSALVVLHAPLSQLLERRGHAAFAELHFRAGELGQHLHLAAARLGIGITCLGGFDGHRCAALAYLEGGEEVVYVLLLGAADESATKHDRLSVAFSHGYST